MVRTLDLLAKTTSNSLKKNITYKCIKLRGVDNKSKALRRFIFVLYLQQHHCVTPANFLLINGYTKMPNNIYLFVLCVFLFL